MRLTSLLSPLLLIPAASAQTVYWLLAGDSTTATDGGWGDGFLSTTVKSPSSGTNFGHSGATTKSFRAGGDWGRLITQIGVRKQQSYSRVYVTIQFGHNDQKATSGVTLDQYKTNLAAFASEVVAAGGTPILLTPLTRRTFGSGGKVVENLANEAAVTIQVANEKGLRWVDLNRKSTDYVNAIGSANADRYNYAAGDRTHLSPWGEVLFARIVSDLLVAKYPGEFEGVTVRNATLSGLISSGRVA